MSVNIIGGCKYDVSDLENLSQNHLHPDINQPLLNCFLTICTKTFELFVDSDQPGPVY